MTREPTRVPPGGAGGQRADSTNARPKAGIEDPWKLPSFMAETNGGGSAERVEGFDMFRAVTSGFQTRRVAGPTTVMARPDAGYFSEGAVPPAAKSGASISVQEKVLGIDGRVIVPDTSPTPWRCICHLEVEYDFGPVGFGTGFLIGPKSVATAAHVIADPEKNKKARRIRIIPGRNGNIAPYGYWVSEFDDCRIPGQWLYQLQTDREAAAAFDYAVIGLNGEHMKEEPIGERLGYFGLKCFDDHETAEAEMLFVNNAGYPYEADKPYGTLWYNAGRVRRMEKTYVEYMVDTEGGQSGSPIFVYDKKTDQRHVIAIHTTGDFVNRGLRITAEVFSNLKDWSGR